MQAGSRHVTKSRFLALGSNFRQQVVFIFLEYPSLSSKFSKEVKNGRVYTVEGNTSNGVHSREYALDDSKITGYVRPF